MDSDIILAEMLPIKYRQSKEASGPYYMPIGLPSQVTCTSALPGKTGKHENHIFTQLDCVTHNTHLCAVFLKEKVVICDVLDSV